MTARSLGRCLSAWRDARAQCGIALLTLLAVIALGAALALVAMASREPIDLRRDKLTVEALAKAKEALIAYAATYSDTHPRQVPGFLPCPDLGTGGIGTEGSAEGSCAAQNVTVIGRLPWKTLGIEPPRDGSGECLWYAVSGSFKNNPKTEILNWDTLAQIDVYGSDGVTKIAGTLPENRAAAVILAPGIALGQDRQDDNTGTPARPICSEDYAPSHYLEAFGAYNNAVVSAVPNAITQFVAANKGGDFNDQLLVITPADIFAAVEKHKSFQNKLGNGAGSLVASAAQCLTQYVAANTNYGAGDHRFPWTAPVTLTAYNADGYYDDATSSLAGRFPYQADTTSPTPVPNSFASPAPAVTLESTTCAFNNPTGTDRYWWQNWKDHLFYALGADFKPSAPSTSPIVCGAGCLRVNGIPGQVAVVMFAGKRLAGQTRNLPVDKGSLANYLEDRNLSNHPNATGNSDYENGPASPTFNDVLYCVQLDGAGIPVAVACP